MRRGVLSAIAVLTAFASLAVSPLTEAEQLVLGTCASVVGLFERRSDDIWPGYDLSERPLAIYIPDRWVLLLNRESGAEGFGPCPDGWPELGTPVCCKTGDLGHLAGQLVFGYDAGGVQCVAVGFPDPLPPLDSLEEKMFGHVVHEAFHQYQDESWGDVPWAREQEYPIEDVENAALAHLEMLLLVDAVEAAWADDRPSARALAAEFVAVRGLRWERSDGFVETYERGKETREGTARYVELRALDLLRRSQSETSGSAAGRSESPGAAVLPDQLLQSFRDRMESGCIAVADLPRNRIYPVAAAQGFLLDYLGADWKREVEEATSDFTYARLLEERLKLETGGRDRLVERAKLRYAYEDLLAAAGGAVARHRDAYEAALGEFEAQGGRRVRIVFDSNGLYRSRGTSAEKLVVDRGTYEFCARYEVYTLELDGTFFKLHDLGLLEENDYEGRRKTVVFYAPDVTALTVDGGPVELAEVSAYSFSSIEMAGDGFELTHKSPGSLTVGPDGILVDLVGD